MIMKKILLTAISVLAFSVVSGNWSLQDWRDFRLDPKHQKKENLDNFARYLQDDPPARGYVVWRSAQPVFKKTMEREIRKITDYLKNEKGIDKERITRITVSADEDRVEFWIVPAGAEPPKP